MMNRLLFQIGIPLRGKITGFRVIVKLMVVGAVLAWSLLLGVSANSRLAILSLGLVLGIVSALILIDNKQLGIAVLIVVAMLSPITIGGSQHSGINSALLMVAYLTGLWIIDMIIRKRRLLFVRTRVNRPIIFLILVVIIAFLNGQLRYFSLANPSPISAQIGGLAIFLFSIFAFLITANHITQIYWLKKITWLFLTIAGVYMVFWLLDRNGINRSLIDVFQLGADASLFWIWVVSLAASQMLINNQMHLRWRGLLLILVILSLIVGFVYQYTWKSGWLPSFISFIVILWFGYPKARGPLVVGGALVVIINLSGFLGTVTGSEDYSLLTRTAAWEVVLEIFKMNPIIGVGIANYYQYTPLYTILGYNGLYFSSHNNYLDLLVQTGLLGLIGFLWLSFEIGWLGWKLNSKVQAGFSKAYIIGVLGGLAGTLVAGMLGDWILPFVYNVGLAGFRSSVMGWLFMGGLVALEQIEFSAVQEN